MKYLLILLLLFTFNVFAIDHYIKVESVDDCNKSQIIYSGPKAKHICEKEGQCLQINELPYNCDYAKKVDEKWLKADSESCTDEENCQTIFESKICSDPEFHKIKNLELMQVYCTKFKEAHVAINSSKKESYDRAIQQQKQAEKDENDAIKAIKKTLKDSDTISDQDLKKVLKFILNRL